MSQFAIFVTIKLKPGTAGDFRRLILENAEAAVRDEPECRQFQVMTDENDPETFFFYEVYDAASSLDHHRETPHYQKYMKGSEDMIADRSIQLETTTIIEGDDHFGAFVASGLFLCKS